ncbi:MAG: hypothetical protein KTR29_03070 [Rhodothermaceae bacterium]|nr:hypothetical protein [Rhodothermaceae bacterium]
MKTFFLVFLLISVAGNVYGQSRLTYDEYGQLPRKEQVAAFNEISPENRAEIVKQQIARWLDKNREALSDDQIGVLETAIKKIQPSLYDEKLDATTRQKVVSEFLSDLGAVLSNEQIAGCCGAGAPYISPEEK